MIKDISRRLFLRGSAATVVGAGFGAAAFAAAPESSLRPRVRPAGLGQVLDPGPGPLVEAGGVSGDVSFVVADVRSGKVLESHNGGEALPPASVTKVVTALYALETLGAEHRFSTKVVAVGSVTNGVLDGDLVLLGGGDPTLNTDGLATIAARLKEAGLREVRGQFLVYGGALPQIDEIDPQQAAHVGYNPAVSGISLNYNRVHFEWKPGGKGYTVTMDARSERYRPEVRVAAMKVVDRSTPVYTYADKAGRDQWTVARGALGKGGSRWLPVRKPEIYVGEVFQTLARANGIALKAPKAVMTRPVGTVLVTHHSEKLSEIIRGMLKYSTNLTAEMIGLAASVKRGGTARSLSGSARMMSEWAGAELGMRDLKLVDHSGLGDASRMRVDELVSVLVQAQRRNVLQPMMKKYGLRHENGAPNRAHPIKVQAKTGTLDFVSALAGYVVTPNGRHLAFAYLSADGGVRRKTRRSDGGRPKGARSWNRKSRRLQQKLIERWGEVYGS
jgi:D-alanyl-D-alanine carboxypeptidase/D-alanyl-D-alanine-endopeptidase (penicillin-binding protein 4)